MYSFKLSGWQESVQREFRKLFDQRETALATLFCEGRVFKAHPRILYANSDLGREIIVSHGSRHPFSLMIEYCEADILFQVLEVLYGFVVKLQCESEANKLRFVLEKLNVEFWEGSDL